MDSRTSQEPAPKTENPLVAVGRKVKSAISTDQQPSVRILRRSASTRQRHAAPERFDHAPPTENVPPKGIGSSIRSFFGRKAEPQIEQSTEEYDADTVDVLDVIGTSCPY